MDWVSITKYESEKYPEFTYVYVYLTKNEQLSQHYLFSGKELRNQIRE